MVNDTWIRILEKYDRKYVGPIYEALRRHYRNVANDLRTSGINTAMLTAQMQRFDETIGNVLMKMYQDVGVFMAREVYKELQTTRTKGLGQNEQWVKQIQEYFKNNLLNKSKLEISTTTKNALLKVLSQAIAEGWSVDMTVSRLENLQEIKNRATRIVRTETVRAANYGVITGAQSYDYETEKTWREIKDNRTRRSHQHAVGVGGETVPINQPFSNGLMFPGDPAGAAKEVINCRCRLTVKAIRDANGDIVVKPTAAQPTQSAPGQVPTVQQGQRRGTVVDALTGIAIGVSITNEIYDFIESITKE